MMSYPAPASMPARPFAPASPARAFPTPGALARPAAPAGRPAAPYGGGAYAAQANRYREAELASASPGQLVVMLYDKMLLTLRRARVAMEARDIEQHTDQVLLVVDMVTELRVSLDRERGGEIAGQLDALYGYMLRELFEANRRQDVARLDVVLGIAGELREAFAGAQAQLAGQQAGGAAPGVTRG